MTSFPSIQSIKNLPNAEEAVDALGFLLQQKTPCEGGGFYHACEIKAFQIIQDGDRWHAVLATQLTWVPSDALVSEY